MPLVTKDTLSQYRRGEDVGSEMLTQDQEVYMEAINMLYGRLESIRTLVIDPDSDISNYPILSELTAIKNTITTLTNLVNSVESDVETSINNLLESTADFESRLNAMDISKANKQDLNMILQDINNIKGYADVVMADYHAGRFTGAQGPVGPSVVDVMIGNTVTGAPGSQASVTNRGTSTNPVLDFTIPQGAKGDKGDQGDQGIQGTPGAAGEQGPQGTPGQNGADSTVPGPQGAAGKSRYELIFAYNGLLETGNGITRHYVSESVNIIGISASVGVAGTGTGNIVVDINKNALGSIYSVAANKPTIAATSYYDNGGAMATTSLAAGDYLTMDIDSVCSLLPGEDLLVKVMVECV